MDSLLRDLATALALLISGAVAQSNIVLIFIDDAGHNELGYTGNDPFLTPQIDALAATGIRMRSGYATQPQCSPLRVGLLPGLWQQRLGYEHNISNSPDADDGLPPGKSATKLGLCIIQVQDSPHCSPELSIEEGHLDCTGPSARLLGDTSVLVGPAGTLGIQVGGVSVRDSSSLLTVSHPHRTHD